MAAAVTRPLSPRSVPPQSPMSASTAAASLWVATARAAPLRRAALAYKQRRNLVGGDYRTSRARVVGVTRDVPLTAPYHSAARRRGEAEQQGGQRAPGALGGGVRGPLLVWDVRTISVLSSAGVAAVPSLVARLRITATVATGYSTLMTTRAYLDEAIAAADAGGRFDPHPLARQFKMTKFQQRAVGADLQRMKLVTVTGGDWQLLDVAREMASALHGPNVDRVSRHGSAPCRGTVPFLEALEKRHVAKQPSPQPTEGVRFRADGLKSHRAKLGLSAADYGRLVGASELSVYNWESGKARPRTQQVAKLAAVRGIGKREAGRRLEMLNGR